MNCGKKPKNFVNNRRKDLTEQQEVTSYKLASIIARYADNRQAKDITILNISNVSTLADYFVLMSADTSTQVRALTSNTKEKVKKLFGKYPNGEEHDDKNRWNLIDYGDVIVHVLHKEEREMYAIEKFWNHSFQVTQSEWEKESEDFAEELI